MNLTTPNLTNALEKGTFPSKILDKSDRLEDLLSERHSLICNLIYRSPSRKELLDCLGQGWNAHH